INGEYLKRLEGRLRREHMSHVHIVRGEPRDPKLPRAAIDLAILAHVYHEIENPYEFLYRLWASLDAGARVAVVDADQPTGRRRSCCGPGWRRSGSARYPPLPSLPPTAISRSSRPPTPSRPSRRSSPAASDTGRFEPASREGSDPEGSGSWSRAPLGPDEA